MKLYDELVARGLIAQVTNEEEIRDECYIVIFKDGVLGGMDAVAVGDSLPALEGSDAHTEGEFALV